MNLIKGNNLWTQIFMSYLLDKIMYILRLADIVLTSSNSPPYVGVTLRICSIVVAI